jgi:hypothetical protein
MRNSMLSCFLLVPIYTQPPRGSEWDRYFIYNDANV